MERIEFHCFLFVRSGVYEHSVDFETIRCGPGSCVSIAPGQVHRFGAPSRWDGAMLVVDAHYAPIVSADLPTHITTTGATADAIAELFDRIRIDAASTAGRDKVHPLLVAQVQVLVARLELAGGNRPDAPAGAVQPTSALFRSFDRAIDEHFRSWHQVADYARSLGCTTKSLLRASQSARGTTAKAVIVQRIILEAKRMLALSTDPVERIGAELGFDEATNFTKFFRRETGLTPRSFRSTVCTS